MIAIASIDDHAVVRAGLEAMLVPERDLVYEGGASDEAELSTLLQRSRPLTSPRAQAS